MGRKITVAPTPGAVAYHAARTLQEVCREASGARVRVALSGGSTPRALYDMLAEKFRRAIAWERLEVFFSDERVVPPEHPDSNFGLARRGLLARVPVPPEQVHRLPADAADLDASVREHEELVRQRVPPGAGGLPAFDLIWLGMGADGHTASLFPGTDALAAEQRLVVVNAVPQLEARRLTFTLPLINAARRVQLLVTGAAKAVTVRRVVVDRELDAAGNELPAGRVAPAGEVEWVLDRDAAAELDRGLYAEMD